MYKYYVILTPSPTPTRQNSIAKSIQRFSEADVVVAPHGAALGFIAFMREDAAVVEIGYNAKKGMAFPAPVSDAGVLHGAPYPIDTPPPAQPYNSSPQMLTHLEPLHVTPSTSACVQYYMAISLSVDVRYHLSMAEGGYGTPLRADVQDVVKVTRMALEGGRQ